MGLDISAYSKIVEIPRKEDIEEHYENGDIVMWGENPFLYQLGSLKKGSIYEVKNFISSFRAGSYSGYGVWRRKLLSLFTEQDIEEYWKENFFFVDYEYHEYQTYIRENKLNRILENGEETIKSTQNMPFAELLNFSDAEGFIGPEVCEKLYLDFLKYDKDAKREMDEYHYRVYKEFMDALSVKGCILHFH